LSTFLKTTYFTLEMCLQLQLSFLTNGEKQDIMTCPPLNDKLREIRQDILQKRGNNVSQPFLHEIESLIKSRDKGYPKVMKKPVKNRCKQI